MGSLRSRRKGSHRVRCLAALHVICQNPSPPVRQAQLSMLLSQEMPHAVSKSLSAPTARGKQREKEKVRTNREQALGTPNAESRSLIAHTARGKQRKERRK